MKLVTEYETSGLQQKDFCAKHDVSLNTLQYWLYKRTRRSGSESGSPKTFHAVELPSGVRVHLSSDVPARCVAELLSGLR